MNSVRNFIRFVLLFLNYTLNNQFIMNFRSLFIALTAIFCFSVISAESAVVADCSGTCSPSVSPITEWNYSCNKKIFGVNTGRNSPCEIIDYVWTTNDPSATIVDAGGQAMVTFNGGAGTYEVCVTFIVGYDADSSGTIDPSEQCSASVCNSNVSITC